MSLALLLNSLILFLLARGGPKVTTASLHISLLNFIFFYFAHHTGNIDFGDGCARGRVYLMVSATAEICACFAPSLFTFC